MPTVNLKSLIAPHFWGTFKSKITNQIDTGRQRIHKNK